MRRRWLTAPRFARSTGWWRAFLAGGALCLAAPIAQAAPGAPGSGRAWTIGYGIAAAVLFAAALAYAARRRMPRRGPWASHHWVQMHVYGGTVFLFFLVLHTGLRAPAGPLPWGLWASSLWVVATGLAGVFIQKWVPAALTSGLTTEVHYDRIPELVAVVRERVERLVAAGGEPLRTFHRANLAAMLDGPRMQLVYVVDVTGGIQSHLRRFDAVGRLLGADDARRLEEVRALMRTKLEMDAHYTLQKALRWWLYAHAPAAVLLAVLVAAHVFVVLHY